MLQSRLLPNGDTEEPLRSIEAVARLLTRDNRRLLAIMRDSRPKSIAALAELSGRSQSNVARTLSKLEAMGFVSMKLLGRQKSPMAVVKRVTVEINPYAEDDVITVDKEY